MTAEAAPLIEVRDLLVRAGSATILDHINLSVMQGEIIALVGPNGAGKSTLLRVLSGELRPAGGAVLMGGRPIGSYSPKALAERRAMLSQHTNVTFPFTVSEIVKMGASPSGRLREMDKAVLEVLARCDVEALAHQAVTRLSGGEQQRVHLARTLLQLQSSPQRQAKLLLLDEPTASLDLAHQLMVMEIVKDRAGQGSAVVVVLHDLNLAAMLATRMVMMKRGRVVVTGEPKDVVRNDVIEQVFGVGNSVGIVPPGETPFVLPQSMRTARKS